MLDSVVVAAAVVVLVVVVATMLWDHTVPVAAQKLLLLPFDYHSCWRAAVGDGVARSNPASVVSTAVTEALGELCECSVIVAVDCFEPPAAIETALRG